MGSSLVRSFIIDSDYGYRYLLEVYSELSVICFMSWLHYYSIISLHNCPVLEIVSLSFLELYQMLQYSYDCSSMMFVHPKGGGSAWDTRVLLINVDVVSGLIKCCLMLPFHMVCRDHRQVVTAMSMP